MITGFNTDVKHGGVTYHVQTEDKGLDSPLILSLVYVGGAIIASKRTPYEDLVGQGFDEKALTDRLQRQHKLICAAIKAGRIADLKRMGGQNGGSQPPPAESEASAAPAALETPVEERRESPGATPPAVEEVSAPQIAEAELPSEEPLLLDASEPARAPSEAAKAEPEIVILTTLSDEISALGDLTARHEPKPFEAAPAVEVPDAAEDLPVLDAEILESPDELSDELFLSLLDDEGDFRAGQLVTVKVYVGRGVYGERPEPFASVTVKVLGTSFRPLIMTATTDEYGVGVVRALLPRFGSGRAAIIIRAASGDDAVEMRRIIHQ